MDDIACLCHHIHELQTCTNGPVFSGPLSICASICIARALISRLLVQFYSVCIWYLW